MNARARVPREMTAWEATVLPRTMSAMRTTKRITTTRAFCGEPVLRLTHAIQWRKGNPSSRAKAKIWRDVAAVKLRTLRKMQRIMVLARARAPVGGPVDVTCSEFELVML